MEEATKPESESEVQTPQGQTNVDNQQETATLEELFELIRKTRNLYSNTKLLLNKNKEKSTDS